MEGLIDDLQQQTLLWIHHFWFCWAQSEEGRIEAVGVFHETTVAHRHHTRHLARCDQNELEVGPNKGVERRKQGQNSRNKRQFGIWQTWDAWKWKHEICINLRKGRAPWMKMLLTLKWPSRHHLAGRQMAVSFLDPVETLPHLHQSRHPHPIVPMESQQCRPCRWNTRVPTQPASRSLPGCLAVFCYYSSLRSSAISNESQI